MERMYQCRDRVMLLFACAALIAFVIVTTAKSQDRGKQKDPDVQTVEMLLKQPTGVSTGFSEKQSNRLGDRVSSALLKIYKPNDLEDPVNIRLYLPIIRSAFEYPNLAPAAYRQPRVTMPLLRRLLTKVADVDLKREISDLSTFVVEQTQRKSEGSRVDA